VRPPDALTGSTSSSFMRTLSIATPEELRRANDLLLLGPSGQARTGDYRGVLARRCRPEIPVAGSMAPRNIDIGRINL
jgi:hypothetical protein